MHMFVLSDLQDWVYRRCKQAGLPQPAAVHLVSSTKGSGVQDLMTDLQEKVGARGDVWVVGAQNAGKSSLINAMQKVSGVKAKKQITTAALPGTTLGNLHDGVHADWCVSYIDMRRSQFVFLPPHMLILLFASTHGCC